MRITEAHYTNITPIADRLEACKAALEICLSETIDNPPEVHAFFRSVRFGLDNWEFIVEFDEPYRTISKAGDSEIHYIHDDGVTASAIHYNLSDPNPLTIESKKLAAGQDWDDAVPEILAHIVRTRSIRECMKLRDEIPAPVGFEEVVN